MYLSKTPLKVIAICFFTFIILCFLIPTVLDIIPARLTGRWELTEDSSGFDYIEFFSNGSYVSSHSNYEGAYYVDGNRMHLEGDLVDDKVFTFKIKGKTLNFYNDEGELFQCFPKSAIIKRRIAMKKIINGYFIGTLITLLLVGGVAYAAANIKTIDVIYDNIKIFKDNVLCELKDANGTLIEPFIYNCTTYMPVRGTANLANMQVTWDGETKSVYLWDEQVPSGTYLMEVCPPYELRSFRSYSSAEGKSFKMGGTRYSDGIVSPDSWDTDRVALFNIDSKFSSLECVIGHVTNEKYAKSVSFIIDGKIVDTIRIKPDSLPKKVRIPLKYGLQLKIMVNELDDGKMSGVGIGNITIQ